jgi:sterol desaturase/sphingolipid hydroxylase (fatty acid hydroxylase superfamily)
MADRLAEAERDALRARLLGEIPSWYRPSLHLAVPTLFGVAVLTGCFLLLRDLRWWDLLAVPITLVIANINEWRAHKYLLHKRSRLAPVLYDRHTPQHHMIYLTDDMAMRDRREYRLVLIPAYGVMLIFVSTLLPAAALWYFGLRNVACLFVATSVGYTLSYEWLHLSYHLPADSAIGRLRLIRVLRHHHAVHHDPTLMQRWNFNVTLPLWDWVMGTLVRSREEARERTIDGRVSPVTAGRDRPP